MRVAFAADHAGAALKDELIRRADAAGLGHESIDLGGDGSDPIDDYPDFAAAARPRGPRRRGRPRDPDLRLRRRGERRRQQDPRDPDRRLPRHLLGPPGRRARRHERPDARLAGHRPGAGLRVRRRLPRRDLQRRAAPPPPARQRSSRSRPPADRPASRRPPMRDTDYPSHGSEARIDRRDGPTTTPARPRRARGRVSTRPSTRARDERWAERLFDRDTTLWSTERAGPGGHRRAPRLARRAGPLRGPDRRPRGLRRGHPRRRVHDRGRRRAWAAAASPRTSSHRTFGIGRRLARPARPRLDRPGGRGRDRRRPRPARDPLDRRQQVRHDDRAARLPGRRLGARRGGAPRPPRPAQRARRAS